jgi:RNA polymerase sigma-70 factor (ECF subfamily)
VAYDDTSAREEGVGRPPSVAPDGEAAIIARLLTGDEAAFETLMTLHHPVLSRLARSIVKNPAVAEEVLQDTWAAILDGLARFEGRAALRTWMCRILMNHAKRRWAREARTSPFSSFGDSADVAVDPSQFSAGGFWAVPPSRAWDEETPEGLLLRREIREALEREILRLPEAQRTVVTLRDLEGWPSDEVCNVLEISESNQRVLLHRARTKIRAALEPLIQDRRR